MEVMSSAKAKQLYGGEIEQLRAQYGGNGSVITKMQDNGSGSKSGPYAWFIAPPSGGRKWHYLGPVEETSGAGAVGNSESTSSPETLDEYYEYEEGTYGQQLEDLSDALGIEIHQAPDDKNADLEDVEWDISDKYELDEIQLRPAHHEPWDIRVRFTVDGFDTIGGTRTFDANLRKERDKLSGGAMDDFAFKLSRRINEEAVDSGSGDITAKWETVNDFGTKVVLDSPYEAKDDINDLEWDKYHPSWSNVHDYWTIDRDGYQEALRELEEEGYEVDDVTDSQEVREPELRRKIERRAGIELDGHTDSVR